jgi:hypothetical protein
MKNLKYIILILIAILCISSFSISLGFKIPWEEAIKKSSIKIDASWDIVTNINTVWFSILGTVKLILEWILVIFIVYIWIQMIWSMWDDEDTLSKAKKQLRYSVVALLFVNIPWSIYSAFHKTDHWRIWNRMNNSSFTNDKWDSINIYFDSNMFFDVFNFRYTFWEQIVWFLEVMILVISVVMIIYEWLKLITSRWREEQVTEAKTKVTYSILALVFVWVIEVWKQFAFSFKVSQATSIFSNLADLALFFAAPVAFFFLTLAWYYYITSAWDEEKVKKAKSIVINTILATLILLAAYTFLLDLANL